MKAQEKGIELIHDIENDIWIFADFYMINTVIRNLISNALKFTPKNGRIEVGAYLDENVNIFVKDDGVGMSKSAQEKIFRIDQHHSTLGTENEQGTGLGLILCKELIEKNNGSIKVESEEGKGATFLISIPKGNLPIFDDEK
jgi:signal transduction histidine kinase